jgi:hypothetical protein
MGRQAMVKLSEGTPSVFLATPTYDGKVGQAYVMSLVSSVLALKERGIGVTYSNLAGNCHVDDARNEMTREFMASGCDSLVFLDADVGWRAEDLVSLVLHDRDIVAGVYPKKTQEGMDAEFPVFVAPGTVLLSEDDGCVEVSGAPTGFMKITRHAMEIMHEKHGSMKHYGQNDKPGALPLTILFERGFDSGFRRSGDYNFCHKWRQTGGKVYVDPRWTFIHEGDKQWVGCLGDHWKAKYGVTKAENDKAFDDAIKAVRDHTAGLAEMEDLLRTWGNPYAATPDLLYTIMLLTREADGPILETGSGLSTLVMALSTHQDIHTFEHSPVWAQFIENHLAKNGLTNVTLHCEPLKDYGDHEWYEIPEDLPHFSMVVCDGPPSRGPHGEMLKGGREGLMMLRDQVQGARFVFDDASNHHGNAVHDLAEKLGIEIKVFGEVREYAVSI